jgi:hypothetical protein
VCPVVRKRALVVNVFPVVLKRMEGCLRRFLHHSVSDPFDFDQRERVTTQSEPDGKRNGVDGTNGRSLPRQEVRGSGEITLRFEACDPLA